MNNKVKNFIRVLVLIMLCGYLAMNIYEQGCYKGDEILYRKYKNEFLNHTGTDFLNRSFTDTGEYICAVSKSNKAAMIFYPGGRVDPAAYVPLMCELADRGIDTIVAKMPLELAVLDIDAAKSLRGILNGKSHWYIGGHSLGGAMAAAYLSDEKSQSYDGLILLGAYSTQDLSYGGKTDKALSIIASEDKVMNRDKYNECYSNLPRYTAEIVIDGGCHSYFGSYGMQKGDGVPTITRQEQTEQVADYIAAFIARDMAG